ncbi:MAG: N-6 DNA methylase [Pirellulales bacterium]
MAEDRELLHSDDASKEACDLYDSHYSTRRLRELALKMRGTKHADLWHALSVVFDALGKNEGCPQLGVSGLGSFLWRASSTADLLGPHQANGEAVLITNDDLLQAIRALAYVEQERVLRMVDYRNLGSEELGSVYESLLELHPVMDVEGKSFNLMTAAGNERKTSGSYYTHELIVQALLDRSLEPLVLERIQGKKGEEAENAILDLKVCDPATGSGHFLIAVAHRLARHLARVRTGEAEPSPEDYQHALRDVIGRCIYGVDINPMAVELCKVSLWMEAIEPSKPLTFLDHHIQCGNSVVGATPALLKSGIPNEAFKGIEGDDPAVCAEYRSQNRDERRGQTRLDFGDRTAPWKHLGNLAIGLAQLERDDDDSVNSVRKKEQRYEEIVSSTDYLYGRFLADAYCAAFFWFKTKNLPYPITEETFRRIEKNPHNVAPWMREEIQNLAQRYQFFHWHLSFPGVFRVPAADETPENGMHGWNGGFDLMLGNPPWDTLSPDAKEFFAAFDEQVRFQDREGQAAMIESLLENDEIAKRWAGYRRRLYSEVLFFKNSGRYRLYAPGNLGKGDFNIFRMFAELSLDFTAPGGCVSQVVPDGLYGGANCMAIRRQLFEQFTLSDIWGFENSREVWFKGIDSRSKFCLYSAKAVGLTDEFSAAFGIRTEGRLASVRAGDQLSIPVSLVKEFSPEALAIPEFANQYEIDIARKMYSAWPKFGDETVTGPRRVYMREIDMGTDRDLFSGEQAGYPLYEGRMVWQYDYRAKGYRSGRGRRAVWEDLPFGNSGKSIQPQWYIPEENVPDKVRQRMNHFRIGFCDVSSPSNERSLVAALLPAKCLSGHKVPTLEFEPSEAHVPLVWLATANSFAMDFIIRHKVGLTMSYTLLDSMPFPRLASEHRIVKSLVERVLLLSCTGPEMNPFWQHLAEHGWCKPHGASDRAPGALDEDVRLMLRAELDVLVGRDLYGLTRDEMAYILGNFPTAERYEVDKYGEFRSQRLIFELFETLEIENGLDGNTVAHDDHNASSTSVETKK